MGPSVVPHTFAQAPVDFSPLSQGEERERERESESEEERESVCVCEELGLSTGWQV